MGVYHEKHTPLVEVRAVMVDSLLEELIPVRNDGSAQLLWLQVM